MNGIRRIQKLSELELQSDTPESASWHAEYADSPHIYIGGLPLDLKEEDIITIFSQYGTPVMIKLVRDKETGDSKGFCFLQYQDQRSTILLVDNFNGIKIYDRVIKVDHCRYKPFTSDDPAEMEREREYQERMNKLLAADVPSKPLKAIEDVEDEFLDPMAEFLTEKSRDNKSGVKKSDKKDSRSKSPRRSDLSSYKTHRH